MIILLLFIFRIIQVIYIYMVVDLKVLNSIVYDDDPEYIKMLFGDFFFELAKD